MSTLHPFRPLLVVFALAVSACSSPASDGAAPVTTPDSKSDGAATVQPGAFGFKCTKDAECTVGTDSCVFSTSRGGVGFCSRPCENATECPAQYDCQNIGGAARKYCVPEDHLASCKSNCERYNLDGCFADGGLAKCNAACDAANVTKRKDFEACFGTDRCDDGCLSALASDGASWLAPKTDTSCERDSTIDPQCGAMGKPSKGYQCKTGKSPTQSGCESFLTPDSYCCPE